MWDNQILAMMQGYGVDIGCGMDACLKATHLVDCHPEVARRYQNTHTVHIRDINEGFESWKDDSFDFVTCKDALHYLNDPKYIVDEMIRITRPKGKIFISSAFNDQILLAAKTFALNIESVIDSHKQEFLIITNPINDKRYLTQLVSEEHEVSSRYREFSS